MQTSKHERFRVVLCVLVLLAASSLLLARCAQPVNAKYVAMQERSVVLTAATPDVEPPEVVEEPEPVEELETTNWESARQSSLTTAHDVPDDTATSDPSDPARGALPALG